MYTCTKVSYVGTQYCSNVLIKGVSSFHYRAVALVHLLDVVCLLILLPLGAELVNLAGHVPLLLQVKGLEHFTEATFAYQVEEEVALMEGRVIFEP